MKPDQRCNCPEEHTGHLCELESQQEWEVIRHVTDEPTVQCGNCGGVANSSKFVCLPEDL